MKEKPEKTLTDHNDALEALRIIKEKKVFLLRLADTLQSIADPLEIQYEASRILAQTLGANRTGYAEDGGDNTTITISRNYINEAECIQGTYNYNDYGLELLSDLQEGNIIVRSDIAKDNKLTPAEKKAHAILRLGATVNAPIVKDGKLAAVLFVHFNSPHQWQKWELDLIKETAQRTWAAVIQARAEAALRLREKELARIQETGGVAGIDIDVAGGLVAKRSPEYIKLHGLAPGITEETHEDWLARLHPEDREEADTKLREALAGTTAVYQSEYRIIRPIDKKVRWIFAKVEVERDSEGNPLRLIGAHIDITHQKEMEKALKESEEHLASIFASAAVGLSEISDEGKFLRVNDTLCKMLGRTKEELLTIGVADVTAQEYIQQSFDAVKNLFETGVPVTLDKQYIKPDGTRVWANSTLSVLSPGRMIVVTADLTARKEAEEALKASEQKYRVKLESEVKNRTLELNENKELLQATLDSSLDMIQVFKAVRNKEGRIIDFIWVLNNNIAKGIYGDVIGKSLLKHNPGVLETGIFSHFAEVTETGRPMQYEKHYTYEQFNGWFYQSVVKLDDGVATTTIDITARKNSEKQINQLNTALVAKNRELESVNSELKTFNDIAAKDYRDSFKLLYTNLEHIIKTDAPKLSDAGKGNIRKTQSALNRLKLLTEDIVSYSRISNPESEQAETNLNDVLDETLHKLLNKIKEKEAVVKKDNTLPVITGFPLLLSLLFYHIIDNGIKFTTPERKPEIVIKHSVIKGSDEHEALTGQNYHKISFTDNGIGVKQTSKIFRMFFRGHEQQYKGSGIGLAMCKKIMELHNGHISAKQEDKGSTFCCYFPTK